MSSEMLQSVVDLPPCNRHIATHDSTGKSYYHTSPAQSYFGVPNAGGLARSFSVPSVPAVLKDDVDVKAYLEPGGLTSFTNPNIVTPNGANLLVVDLAPGGISKMHRTVSIDFSICVIGTIIHELDGGEKVTLKPGDHIVQRGTNHRWHNASKTEPARFVAVTLGAVPFVIPGTNQELTEIHLPDDPQEKL